MKTKFVRILSVLLAIAMLAACSVIVSATTASSPAASAALKLVAGDITTGTINGKSEKIITISLVCSEEICYNIEGSWYNKAIVAGEDSSYFELARIDFNSEIVDTSGVPDENGLPELVSANAENGKTVWFDTNFSGESQSAPFTVFSATYIVDENVTAGEYTFSFNVEVYTGADKNPQETSIELTTKVSVSDEPQGTLRGDINLDEVVDMLDFVALARHIGEVEFISKPDAQINADVNGDEVIDMLDFVKLAQYVGEVISDLE